MKKVHLVHNPSAGNGNHQKKELLEKTGVYFKEVGYTSTHEPDWERFTKANPEMILIGGGDGTVHKVAKVLLNGEPMEQRTPLGLLPLGTANNISQTLNIRLRPEQVNYTGEEKIKKFDVGRVKGLKNQDFFLEAAGFGIFPRLVTEMDKAAEENGEPEDELQKSLETLLQIVKEYDSQNAEIKADGEKIEGPFLLVELMNIQNIGPGFQLAPNADPGDGYLDLVMIPEESREQLQKYVEGMLKGEPGSKDLSAFVSTRKVKKVIMKWAGKDVHVDDDPVESYSGESFEVVIEPDALRFLEPRLQ